MMAGLLMIVFVIWFGWWLFDSHRVYPASIYVESGEPFYKVVVKLRDREVIGSPWFFSKVGMLAGLDRRIIPGRYDFSSRLSNYDVLRTLWQGRIARLSFTVPEGYSLSQIGQLLHQRCGTDLDVFNSLARDSIYLDSLGIKAGFAEGYLFPETYNFQWGITSHEVFESMAEQLFVRLDDTLMARADSLGYDLDGLLTMASIIEMEGSRVDEFGKIASVYANRRRIGMKLQADPTVIYGMGGLDRKLQIKDYEFPSRYNTYLHHGLPPTPICSPGMAAIRATLYPDSTDYLYFVADGTGYHVFNKTYSGHLTDTRKIKSNKRH
ncbi:MAG: endolytic transglycosylase MltG [FCB group bacterium]|nr:endolytic transglycosylase MltG [FCB group bacterium]